MFYGEERMSNYRSICCVWCGVRLIGLFNSIMSDGKILLRG